jgi:hypothetical protein
MLRWIALVVYATGVCATASLAQTPAAQTPTDLFNRPPADVDQALRARISEFYQDHVDGKFRQAEALVAEDTKDFYYSAAKTKYLSFEIQRIDYTEGFTRAKATVLCEQYVMIPGFTDKPLKVPTPSTWKLLDGQWFWYVDPEALRLTPFGKMTPGPSRAGASPPALPSSIPTLKDMDFIFSQVKPDKTAVKLKPGEPEKVVITNRANGPVSLTLTEVPPGVDAKLDHANIAAGDKATLTLRAAERAKPGVLSLRVDQTNRVIPIQVAFE